MPIAGMLASLLYAAVAVTTTAGLPVNHPVVRVLVQTEPSAGVERRVLTDAVAAVHAIWRPYADITFDLADTVRSSGLRLVITDRMSTSDGASLGWIEFVDGRPANLITVSTTAANALMKASRWSSVPKNLQRTFLARALARAIAHELGHYLLASREHAARGLMRGQLTADDVMQPRSSSYRLDRAQVERLQRGVLYASRAEEENAGRN